MHVSVEKSPCHTVHVENFSVFRLDDVTIRAFVSCYVFLNVINSYINSTLCGVELVTEKNTITEIYGVVLEEIVMKSVLVLFAFFVFTNAQLPEPCGKVCTFYTTHT